MEKRFLAKSAVMALLLRENDGKQEILLQRRKNTGYADGLWDCAASGHVDEGEPMTAAVIREAKEELGITVDKGAVRFATLTHKYTPATTETYYNAFFVIESYQGQPQIMEPEKCGALAWFALDRLPEDLLEDRRLAISNYLAGIAYDEQGWGAVPGCLQKDRENQ